jgi:spore maturation protein CgeB
MKVAYHLPHPDAGNAYRTICQGFKNAFVDLGHEFHLFSADENLSAFLQRVRPDVFLTATHFYYRRYLDFALLRRFRDEGMKVFVRVDFWESPLQATRINEARSLKNDTDAVRLIRNGEYGDFFYHPVEQGDPRMEGFEQTTGYGYHTIPLAADKILLKGCFDRRFEADVSFIGTCLPQKREYFREYLFPLKRLYRTRIYGQDWSRFDRLAGLVQKAGQLFNIPLIRSLRKPPLRLEDEATIYRSSAVSVNIHEDYQRRFGGDCNERTFKIPLCGGFEITDDVACIRKYFKEGEEIIIAKDKDDWFQKIDYYIRNPDQRAEVIRRGKERVLRDHTYHNRVQQIMDIYNASK